LSASNLPSRPAIKKYKDRRPKIANALDEKTINGSLEIPNTAGIESKAKTTSVVLYD
jgi:hypothetical protein